MRLSYHDISMLFLAIPFLILAVLTISKEIRKHSLSIKSLFRFKPKKKNDATAHNIVNIRREIIEGQAKWVGRYSDGSLMGIFIVKIGTTGEEIQP